ncbi:MAG: class I SAM-dependent methyltransferase [Selenomonadaceae bacterium]|nr:class I SAM-dependent methyltransferase [Selenomonadaceae bacterium]
MIRLNAIPLDYEPRNKIISELSKHGRGLENFILMSEFDSAFLCGALKTFRPKKILEIGVAAGGSTAIILQVLEEIGAPYEMHSIDLSDILLIEGYTNYSSGFLGTFAKEKIFGNLHGTHKLHLGKILPQVIDEIGGGIDFVILDTVHSLPGEVLDFPAVLPYLADNAVIVLHDVSLHQLRQDKCNATGVLFGAVTAEKFLNFQPEKYLFRYPNIAAFRVNEQTAANIENVFLALMLSWDYWPTDEQVKIYREHYRRFYSDALVEIFQDAVDMNAYNFAKARNND